MRRVFISYASEDEPSAVALADHLDQLRSLGIAETWLDRGIQMGEKWEPRLDDEIAEADMFLILVSHNYLARGFAHDTELPLIERAVTKGATAIPVVVEECSWRSHPFIGSLNAWNSGKRLEARRPERFARQAASLVEDLAALVQSIPAVMRDEPADVASSVKLIDDEGLAFKGSQLQTQLYVNEARSQLQRGSQSGVATGVAASAEVTWCSPLRESHYVEYRDGEFLAALRLTRMSAALKEFWPLRGPRWDALAKAEKPVERVILAEGKSYPGEMSSSSKASGESREQIAKALASTQGKLGLEQNPESWMRDHYPVPRISATGSCDVASRAGLRSMARSPAVR